MYSTFLGPLDKVINETGKTGACDRAPLIHVVIRETSIPGEHRVHIFCIGTLGLMLVCAEAYARFVFFFFILRLLRLSTLQPFDSQTSFLRGSRTAGLWIHRWGNENLVCLIPVRNPCTPGASFLTLFQLMLNYGERQVKLVEHGRNP